MKYIAIITDNILFSNLFIPLIKRNTPDVEVLVWNNYTNINNFIDTITCDLILLDGGISNVSSIEVIQYLRMTKLEKSPIWFFPEILTSLYLLKANQLGINRTIQKPFDPYQVNNEISALFVSK